MSPGETEPLKREPSATSFMSTLGKETYLFNLVTMFGFSFPGIDCAV